MRRACELDRQQLVDIVESIQGFLYLDLDRRGTEYWNPDKEFSGADICEHVAGLLGQHDLAPQHRQSVDGSNYVLYEFDARQLLTTIVYTAYQDAADDAAELDNVLILRLDIPMRDDSPVSEPVTVRLHSEEFGAEDFHYDDLDEALAAIARLYHQCRQQDDQVQRQIGILVGALEEADED